MSTENNSTAIATQEQSASTDIKHVTFGNFNYDQMIAAMPEEQRQQCLAKAQSINPNDISSIQTYGSELNRRMGSAGDVLLKKVRVDRENEVIAMTTELLAALRVVDIDDFQESGLKRVLKKIPFMKHIIRGTQEMFEKTDSVLDKVGKITAQIQTMKTMADSDNSMLQGIQDNIKDYIVEIREFIAGAKLRLEELKDEMSRMASAGAEPLALHHMSTVINSLEKRIGDMLTQEFMLNEDAMRIEIMIKNNYDIGDCAENITANIIPMWKNQIVEAVSNEHQRKSIEATAAVYEFTNEMLKKNSKTLKENAIEIAKQSEKQIIEIETIEQCKNDLIETVNQIRQIKDSAAKNRAQLETTLQKFAEELNGISREA